MNKRLSPLVLVLMVGSFALGCGAEHETSDGTGSAGGSGSGGGGSGAGGSAAGGGSSGHGANGGAAGEYLDAINAIRAAVGKPDNYAGTWTPLPMLEWSDALTASAQAWANRLGQQNCTLQHEEQRTYGENLAMGTALTPRQAVDMWASERSRYTWSPTYSMADFNAGSGHYTQLVWRKSAQVGCASATCSRGVVISCRFSPPGNMIGQAAY